MTHAEYFLTIACCMVGAMVLPSLAWEAAAIVGNAVRRRRR